MILQATLIPADASIFKYLRFDNRYLQYITQLLVEPTTDVIAPQVAFCCPDSFTMKNAGLSVLHQAVVLNKQMAKMCS